MNLRTKLFKSRQKKNDKIRFNSNGSSLLATLLGVATGIIMVAIVSVLFQISSKVNDINTGKVADGRLSGNVAHYNDPAPTFEHWVKAPGFIGELKGNADTATALVADPSDCFQGSFADGIDTQGNLFCTIDGSGLTGVNAVTLGGLNVSDFQNASNMNTGTVSDNRLSARVTLQGNTFNGASQLVQLASTGALPALDGAALNNLNASNLMIGTVNDARLSTNVALYNATSPTFANAVTAPAFNGALNGNATTATSLQADPTDCAVGSFANGIVANGDLTCSTDGSLLTNLNASTITSGTLSDARLSANVTMQGNTFNGAGQLVQLDGLGALPALDGFNLTNLNGANVTGAVANALTADALSVNPADCAADNYATAIAANGDLTCATITDAALSANVVLLDGSHGLNFTGAGVITADAFQGDGSALTNLTGANVNGAVALATNALTADALSADPVDCAAGLFATTIAANGDLTCSNDGSSLLNLDAGNITTGTLNDARLSANVTLQGNSFNGASQLVQLDGAGLLPSLDGSALTNLTGANVVGSVATADALTVDPADCAVGSFATTIAANGDLTCSNDGALLVNLDASNITTGTLADARLSTNVTLMGNTFNGASQLVQLDAAGLLPALDGSALTNLTGANVTGVVANAQTAVNFTGALAGDVTGTQGTTVVSNVNDSALSANVTLQGNTFNGASQLVQLDGAGNLPALDGSALTNLTGANVVGAVALATNSLTADALSVDPADCVAGSFANAINTAGDLACSNDGALLVNLDASNIATGTLSDARLSANVTLGGNNFNLANGLVQLDGTGKLPALDGSALTNITVATAAAFTVDPADCAPGQYAQLIAANGDLTCNNDGSTLTNINAVNITAGTLNDARLSGNVTLGGNNFNLANGLVQLTATGALPALDGSALTNITTTNFTGNLAGDVTGTQGATVVANVSDSALSVNVTLAGNNFNGANQLVQLDGAGSLPALNGAAITNITGANVTGTVANATNAVNALTANALGANPLDCAAGQYAQAIAANGDLTCNNDGSALTNLNATNISAGTLSDARLSTNVTLAGNVFNGAGQLVQLTGVGALPALDGSALTNLTGANVTGTVANANTANTATTANSFTVNPADCTAGQYAQAIAANGDLSCNNDASALVNINAANISAGTVNDLRLSNNVTLAGNTFNGANQLVRLNGAGELPAVNGANVTNITGANVTGTVANATNAVVATTANALSVDPTDCAANTYANAIAASGNLTCASITDAALSANVTLAGNTFNGANQLVRLNGASELPVVNGANVTNLTGGNVQGNIGGNASNVTGVVGDANVTDALTINGGSINNTVIGGATPAAATFTTLNAATLTTSGAVNANSLAVTNSATIGGSLIVTGATTHNGAVTINSTLNVTGLTTLATLTVTGATTHTGTTAFNNTVTATAGVNFSTASSMRIPVTATNIIDGITGCAGSGTGAMLFSTNGSFFGCDGAVWQKLDN